jgi:hypothetical protein
MAEPEPTVAGRTFFFTGPPGAGKTSTAALWAIRRSTPTFWLDWDGVHSCVAVADEIEGRPTKDPDAQYGLAAKVMAAQAEMINRSGVDCALSGAWALDAPPEWQAAWDDLALLEPVVIVLLPSLEVCLSRNASDPARRGEFSVSADHVHGKYAFDWARWADQPRGVVIDNSALSLDETVEAIEDAVRVLP